MKAFRYLFTFAAQVIAQERECSPELQSIPDNQFLKPPRSCNPSNYVGINEYTVGTHMTIEWQTTSTNVSLGILQENATDFMRPLRNYITSEMTYDWDGIPPQPLANGNIFFFGLYEPGASSPLFLSDYIRIKDLNAQTTAVSTTAPLQVTSTPSASKTTESTTLSTAAPHETAASDGGDETDNDGTKIGIGVGAGVGGATLMVGGIFALLWYRRRTSTSGGDATQLQTENTAIAAPRDQKQWGPTRPYYDRSPERRAPLEAHGSDTQFDAHSPPSQERHEMA